MDWFRIGLALHHVNGRIKIADALAAAYIIFDSLGSRFDADGSELFPGGIGKEIPVVKQDCSALGCLDVDVFLSH